MADIRTLPGVHVDRFVDGELNAPNGNDKTNGVNSVVRRKPVDNSSALIKSKRTKPKQSYLKWFLSVFTRLLTWYSIITIIFRCPATQQDITDTTPKVCKPYFELKATLLPHVTPYYEKYASPYVESAKPYYAIVDKHVFGPAKVYGTRYGAPRVQQAQALGKAQWEKQVQPQLTKANDIYKQKYDQYAATHVNKLSETAGPYYRFAKDNALLTYHASILPTYNLLHPYALYGYEQGRHFTITTAYPLAKRAWNSTMNFLDRNVLPKIKILYGENVEPQLIRIGERLGRYRDGKKVRAAVEEVNQSASMSSLSSTITSASSTIVSRSTSTVSVSEKATSTTTSTISQVKATGSVKPAETPLTEVEERAKAQKIVEDDLKIWKQKVSKATEEGSNELESRIAEITDRAIQKQARVVGKAHLIRLEETVATELKNLKKSIISIVKLKYKEEDINRAVRKAGLAIRDKAQAVREWRQKYDKETNELVAKAAEDTFQIIDHIRDLGLQEIGMRWAWTDGITHKDWTKYHALKNKFDQWRHDVEGVATQHPGLIHARHESEDIESRAMAIAEDAAKELARLKETGKWKLQAGDASPDFDTKHMPAAAHLAAQKVMDIGREAKAAVVGSTSSHGTMESLSSLAGESIGSMSGSAASVASQASDVVGGYAVEASKSAASAAQSLSARLAGTPSQGSVNSAISAAQASAVSAANEASRAVYGTPQGSVESLASVASISVNSVKAKASGSIIGTSQGTIESVASVLSSSANSIKDRASGSIVGTSQGTIESVASVLSSSANSIKDKASGSIIGTSQGTIESVASVLSVSASSLVSEASKSAESLGSQASTSVYGAPQGSVESVASAIKSSASSVIHGTTQGSVESASSVVAASASSLSAKQAPVVSAGAQKVVDGVKDAVSSVGSVASSVSSVLPSSASSASKSVKKVWGGAMAQEVKERHIIYEDVIEEDVVDTDETYSKKIQDMANQAGDRFHDITKAVSEALLHQQQATATQTPAAVESVTSLASAQYASALSAASVALYGTTTSPQGPGESVLSVASSRYADAVKAASAAIHGTPTTPGNPIAAHATAAYNEALGQADKHYANALSLVSAQISGTPKPSHEAMFSSVQASYSSAVAAANDRLASISSRGSVAAYGTPTGVLESISAIASQRLAEGLAQASSQYSNVKSAVGATPTPQSQRYLEEAKARYYGAVGLAHERYSEFVSSASAAVMPTPTPFHQSLASRASESVYGTAPGVVDSGYAAIQSNYAKIQAAAQEQLDQALSIGKKDKHTTGYIEAASSSYSSVLSAASQSLDSASKAASSRIYGAASKPTPEIHGVLYGTPKAGNVHNDDSQGILGQPQAQYAAATAAAASALSSALQLGTKSKSSSGFAEQASSSYSSVLSAASASLERASREASIKIYGTPTGSLESLTSDVAASAASLSSVASQNWEALVARASVQVYGQPTPWGESVLAQATDSAAAQYVAVQALISELVQGREPDFTASVASRLSSAYHTGIASSASSILSAAGEMFTPPPVIEAILEAAQSKVNEAVEAASGQVYGTSKSPYEKVLEGVSSASKKASVRVYGSETGYVEAASSSIAAAASSAQHAIREAVYGTVTPTEGWAGATSVVGEYGAKVSEAVYGSQEVSREGSVASAQARLGEAVESARVKLAAFKSLVGGEAGEVFGKAAEGIEEFAAAVSSAVTGGETGEVGEKGEVKEKVQRKVVEGDRGFHDEL